MKPLAWLAERLLSVLVPASVARQQAFFTESWLADVEADHEVWEPGEVWPPLADWEQELLDARYMTDEQWAARQRHRAGTSVHETEPPRRRDGHRPNPPGPVRPADGIAPTSAAVGGPPTTGIRAVIAVVLRAHGVPDSSGLAAPITAALNEQFHITRKANR